MTLNSISLNFQWISRDFADSGRSNNDNVVSTSNWSNFWQVFASRVFVSDSWAFLLVWRCLITGIFRWAVFLLGWWRLYKHVNMLLMLIMHASANVFNLLGKSWRCNIVAYRREFLDGAASLSAAPCDASYGRSRVICDSCCPLLSPPRHVLSALCSSLDTTLVRSTHSVSKQISSNNDILPCVRDYDHVSTKQACCYFGCGYICFMN